MDAKLALHRLLYSAFVDIRAFGYEGDDMRIYRLADVFHNTPLAMDRATSEEDHAAILEEVVQRAERNGCSDWLEQRLKEADVTLQADAAG